MPQSPDFDLQIRRSPRRRTAAIEIRGTQVRVAVPSRAPKAWVQMFIERNTDWILERLAQQHSLQRQFAPGAHADGSVFYLGRAYRVEVVRVAGKSGVMLVDTELVVQVSKRVRRPLAQVVGELIEAWLKQQAQRYLPQALDETAQRLQIFAHACVVKGFRRRWGSCDSNGLVALNWRLIMASPEAIEYVLVHELCHRVHFNHSRAFWQLVARYCPAYRQHTEYFKQRACWLSWPG